MKNNSKRILIALLAATLLTSTVTSKAKAQTTSSNQAIYNTFEKEDIEIFTHVVKKGENLSRISKKYYGETSFWKELAIFNGITDPDFVRKGQVINIPKKVEDLLGYVYLFNEESEKTYVVQKGDTLNEIAHQFYGVGGESVTWRLATYNKLYNPNYIKTGQVLLLPSYLELMEVDPIDYVIEEKPTCHKPKKCAPKHFHRSYHMHDENCYVESNVYDPFTGEYLGRTLVLRPHKF